MIEVLVSSGTEAHRKTRLLAAYTQNHLAELTCSGPKDLKVEKLSLNADANANFPWYKLLGTESHRSIAGRFVTCHGSEM